MSSWTSVVEVKGADWDGEAGEAAQGSDGVPHGAAPSWGLRAQGHLD